MKSISAIKDSVYPNVKTLVFVDFESVFYGCLNQYGVEPDIEGWYEDLKTKGLIDEVFFFADFTQGSIKEYPSKLRSIPSSIIDCSKGLTSKDYTDFIILDHIYQKAVRRKDIDQFVLFTGDGHFQSALAFLKHSLGRTVGLYFLKDSLSPQLLEVSDWLVEYNPPINIRDNIAEIIVDSLKWLAKNKPGLYPTYKKTAETIHKRYPRFSMAAIENVLSELIQEGTIEQNEILIPESGCQIRRLMLDERMIG